jgi:hypothetical protein
MQPNDDKVVCKALVARSEWQKNGIQPASAKLLIADYTFDTCKRTKRANCRSPQLTKKFN